ncbi:MAG: hypothetical protein ABJD11_01370 [Gemmatimonadota bacterium]
MIRALVLAVALLLAGSVVFVGYRSHRAVSTAAVADSGAVLPVRMAEGNGRAAIVLDSAAAARVQLGVAIVRAARGGATLQLTGELVPDPSGVSLLRAPVAGRLTPVPGKSWPAFGDAIRSGETIAQVSDARPLAVARGGTVSRVSAQPGELVLAGQELLEITDYAHPLARIVWRSDAPRPAPEAVMISPMTSGVSVRARLVGPAPAADALTRQEAFLYRASDGWEGARPGTLVHAEVTVPRAPAHSGHTAFVPASAVVQWEGLAWAFVQRGTGRYVRTRIATEHPVGGGWLVDSEIALGDTVVTRGAEQLLSEEFRARITVGEEVGE